MTDFLDVLKDISLDLPTRDYRLRKFKEKENLESPWQSARAKLRPFRTQYCDFTGPEIIIGDRSELSDSEHRDLLQCLEAFKPWKKGPFRLFGESIDAEWRSDWKWERIRPHCPSLEGKVIADIGAHNGYYIFRMASENPKMVIGFEPVIKHWHCFDFLQSYAQHPNLYFEPLGVEHIDQFANTFDIIFCLGILYHHTDPIGLLQKMRKALKAGGSLIIDCQGIKHDQPLALMPRGTYAGGHGMWFLPSLPCLLNWVVRSGFREAVCFYEGVLCEEEQRSTPWAPIKSLKDFLSPSDNQKTIEGYPRPWRFYVHAKT